LLCEIKSNKPFLGNCNVGDPLEFLRTSTFSPYGLDHFTLFRENFYFVVFSISNIYSPSVADIHVSNFSKEDLPFSTYRKPFFKTYFLGIH